MLVIRSVLKPLRQGLNLQKWHSAFSTSAMMSVADNDSNSSELKHWRDSATIIIAAKDSTLSVGDKGLQSENASAFDYRLLLLKRNQKSKFMGGAHVFPGGTAGEADFSLEWANVFRYCTKRDLGDILGELNIGRKRPPLLAGDHPTAIPRELAFRIAAIRETFEESGVLLVKGARMPNVEDKVIDEFRKKVKLDPRKFSLYCKELQVVPDVWALQEWSNWLTPPKIKAESNGPSPRPHRFDTVFYLCCLDWIPLVNCDGSETTDAKWVSPDEYFEDDGIRKYGPQPFEMARIHNFPKISVLHTFARQRAALGLERYMSVYLECKDGNIAVLPGDDLYPEKPDYEGVKSSKRQPHTIEELRAATRRHHRQEFPTGSDHAFYVCNIELKLGQPVPHKRLHQMQGGI